MQSVDLKVYTKNETGKEFNGRLRRQGKSSAVLYGPDMKPTMLKFETQDFSKIIFHSPAREHSLLKLIVDDSRTEMALIREVQFNPLTDRVMHVDLLHIHPGYETIFQLPVKYMGTPKGIKAGGTFTPIIRELKVKCDPVKSPDHIEVDVTDLGVGQAIHVRDISIEGLSFVANPDLQIVAVHAPRSSGPELVEEES